MACLLNDQIKKNLLICSIILLLSPIAKSQEFIGANEQVVKKYMQSQNGILRLDQITVDMMTNTKGKMLVYNLPDTNGVFHATFYFSGEGKCIHYIMLFRSIKYMSELVDKFDGAKSELRRIKGEYNWASKINGKVTVAIRSTRKEGEFKLYLLNAIEDTGSPPHKWEEAEKLKELLESN